MFRIIFGILVALIIALYGVYHGMAEGWFGDHEGPGTIAGAAQPADVIQNREAVRAGTGQALGADASKQILFGDFHVHTTFSTDAFATSLPLMGGVGAHPPADACDFARYCSALDFWSLNDHVENMPYRHWQEMVQSVRQCNAVSGSTDNPDMVSYIGWEWTQVGTSPTDHYGHKNVILADLDDDKIPTRPIASRSRSAAALSAPRWLGPLAYVTQGDQRYLTMSRFIAERRDLEPCPDGVAERDMPNPQCYEDAETPAVLYSKLRDWGHRAIVIPHGTTWGFYTPPASEWDKQLVGDMHDPNIQTMIEIYSGHGNSEEYRPWRAVNYSDPHDLTTASCPEPSEGYLPSCWRAGQIIQERCEAQGLDDCDARAAKARNDYARAGAAGHTVVSGETIEDWLDGGQCTDCFQPSFNYRPGGAAQYIMALTNFDDPAHPRRFKFGFMASSDNHSARPGTGYKEVNRRGTTDNTGPRTKEAREILRPELGEKTLETRTFNNVQEVFESAGNPFQILEVERQASFFQSGGLIAVHSQSRNRDRIWEALDRKEVYGTSGPRILLWFDLDNSPVGTRPMGSEVNMAEVPQFTVRAAGSLKQKPGCPENAVNALGEERIAYVCQNECYNPSDERRIITRIEVVRIRPQSYEGEDIATLIDDPWKSFTCPGDPEGCTASFTDEEFPIMGRDALYYARAIEEPSEAINADPLRCEFDADGNCIKTNPCYGDYRTPDSDNCTSPTEQRAWSSPIFVNYSPPVIDSMATTEPALEMETLE